LVFVKKFSGQSRPEKLKQNLLDLAPKISAQSGARNLLN